MLELGSTSGSGGLKIRIAFLLEQGRWMARISVAVFRSFSGYFGSPTNAEQTRRCVSDPFGVCVCWVVLLRVGVTA